MDGLECSEILFSYINKGRRMDAEFFKKELLNEETHVKALAHFYLPLKNVVSGPFGSSLKSESYLEKGPVPFIRISNILGGFWINQNDLVYISEKDNQKIINSALKTDDLILSKVGNSIGYFARVDETICRCNISENNIGIKLQSYKVPMRHYILTYLNCKYGRMLIRRRQSGNGQPKINVSDVTKIPIPSFSDVFYEKISNVLQLANECIDKGNSEYDLAEELLLRDINISRVSLSSDNISIKSFSESFGETGRLDAEYYQKKYDRYSQQILDYAGGSTTPAQEFDLVKTKCTKELDEYPYVEIGDIDIGTGSAEYSLIPTDELPANAKIMTKAGDLLISTVRPNRGAVSILEQNDILVSGAFTVLRETGRYPAQTLQVLFRTPLYKDWFLKFNVGTSYPVIKDNDILNISIPIFGDNVHSAVRKRVQQSQALLSKSKKLLDVAKKSVEMAIEQSEEEAINWLNDTVSEIEASAR